MRDNRLSVVVNVWLGSWSESDLGFERQFAIDVGECVGVVGTQNALGRGISRERPQGVGDLTTGLHRHHVTEGGDEGVVLHNLQRHDNRYVHNSG